MNATAAATELENIARDMNTAATTIYSRPSCQQCHATIRCFDKHALPYTVIDLAETPDAAEQIRDLGYAGIPVVVTADGTHWSGFRPDRVAALTNPPVLAHAV